MNTRSFLGGLSWLVVGAAVALGSPACDPFNAYCTAKIECEGGNDRDLEACEITSQAGADRAQVYECTGEFEAFSACREASSECDEFGFYSSSDKCVDESQTYTDCILAAEAEIQGAP